ncbi:MAG: CBS domain-containing protein [Candidatus Omnitrophica bacterium]|nr:CBS domain-containing protein [Candidatus Omnitrophota bacterium]
MIPRVKDFMTKQPYTITEQTSIAEADKIMKKYNIRHLPVVTNNKVVGMVSDRDLKSANSVKASPLTLQVKYLYHEKPYSVDPNTTLDEVAKEMAKHHYGSAIIVKDDQLVGIFTTVDACKALAFLLESYHLGGGDEQDD